jgi:hypothetical protein
MWFIPLLSSLKSRVGRGQKGRPIRNCRPILEYLEDRRLLSSLTETGVSPNSGPVPGTIVQISGTGFVPASQVFFGTHLATQTSETDTLLTVIAPAVSAGPTDVKVVNPDGQTANLPGAFFAVPGGSSPGLGAPPVVSTISPNSGLAAGGTVVTITGTGFQTGSRVFFGGIQATLATTPTATTIIAVTPALPLGPADVKVLNPDGQQTVIAGGFAAVSSTGVNPPTVTNLSPTAGPPSTALQIIGTGFQPTTQVFIGGVLATVTSVSSTTLNVTVPSLPLGVTTVKVVNPDGQQVVLPSGFTVQAAPAPQITNVSPRSGMTPGAVIQITGTNFQTGSKVFIGGVAATISGTPTPTLITVTAPAVPAGPADVKVVNPDGQQAVLTSGFLSTPTPAPVLFSISPTSGPAAGGTVVSLLGTGFQVGSTVFFGSVGATLNGVPTSTNITVTTPVLPAGLVTVKVVNPDGQQTALPNAFTATTGAALTVTAISPLTGPTAGGTAVQITGTGFQNGTTVFFGGIPATFSSFPTATVLNVVSPALPAGPNDIKVVNPGGQQVLLPGVFVAQAVITAPPPTLSGITPNFGPASGGTLVQISGTGFQPTSHVLIGGVAATISGIPTATSISFITPILPVGAANVEVLNPDGQFAVLNGAFTAQGTTTAPPPAPSGISPNSGPGSGGTVVTITGTGFQPTSQVLIGGFAATVIGTPTSTSITATTPALPAGPANVEVVNPDGQFAVLNGAFTATTSGGTPPPITGSPPVVTGLSPNAGPSGTVITISGTGFQAGSQVFIGGIPAPLSGSPTATRITVIVPALAIGPADVKVVNPDTQQSVLAGGYFVLPGGPPPSANPPPAVSRITPTSGPATGGTVVTITGTGFQASSHVFFGNVAATISGTPTSTTITAITPALPVGLADVKVVNPDNQQSVLVGGFAALTGSPLPPPAVTSVSPAGGSAAGGVVVTITGTGFQAGTKVFFGGIATTISTQTATAITVITPALPVGPADIKIVNPDGQQVILTGGYTSQTPPPPLISSVSPHNGPVPGTIITITGTGFQPTSQVFVHNTLATLTGTQTATTLTVVAPNIPLGVADVKVVNPDGKTSTLVGGFIAQAAPPTITSVSPSSGPATGGTLITITGTGFQSGSHVVIDGAAALPGGTPTSTKLLILVPPLAVGPADVKVINPDGQFAVLAGGFVALPVTTAPPPVIASINPSSGPAAGGTVITITGTGFQATSQVTIGGVAAALNGLPTATSISVIAPALSVGPADVKIVNPDFQQAVVAGGYFALGSTTAPPPVVTNLSPTTGAPGSVVTITGTGFQATTQVTIGGVPATITGLPTSTSLSVIVPALGVGAADVRVVNPDGQQVLLPGAFTVQPAGPAQPPVVQGVTPNAASPGATIQILGTGFQAGSKVFIGGVLATQSGTPTSTTLMVIVPKLPVGNADVKVVNPDGTSSVLPGGFYELP